MRSGSTRKLRFRAASWPDSRPLHTAQEQDRFATIHEAVIISQRQIHHRADHHLAADGDGPVLDRVQAENSVCAGLVMGVDSIQFWELFQRTNRCLHEKRHKSEPDLVTFLERLAKLVAQ